jgi:catechol 2,3-dioxygenase-like lactoylglutathione lyase family enzyme
MLGDHPLDIVLLARDLAASRSFYVDRIGLEVVREQEGAVFLRCGGESRISLSASTVGTADEQTQASWRVDDIDREVAELLARGVEMLEYDTPGLKTMDGIADVGFARVAWFADPGGNVLSIVEYRA